MTTTATAILEGDEDRTSRQYPGLADLRAMTGDDGVARLVGTAIVFGSRSEDLGGFREVIAPDAIKRTLAERVDLRALIDHDPAKVLGRVSTGTLRLYPKRTGLDVEIDVPDTSYGRDLVVSVARGDISGMSFAFRMLTQRYAMQGEERVRTILDMLVREVSVVAFPAYPQTDLSIALRGLDYFLGRPGPDGVRPGLAWYERRQREQAAALAQSSRPSSLRHYEGGAKPSLKSPRYRA